MVEAAYEPHTGRPVLSCACKKILSKLFFRQIFKRHRLAALQAKSSKTLRWNRVCMHP